MEVNTSTPSPSNFTQLAEEIYFWNSVTEWMCIIAPPVIVVLGTFGNVMTLVVLRRIGFGITNIFLRALAISDLVLLYIGLFDAWLKINFNITIARLHVVTCKLTAYSAYSSGVLSAWLIVAMTVQRALSVVWPHRIHLMCTQRKALSLITGIVCFVLILHTHFIIGKGLKTLHNNTSPICDFVTEEFITFMLVVWSWVDLLSFSFLPFVFLAISNSVLVWKLKTSLKNVSLTSGHSDNSGVREKRASSITVTLIVVSLTFLALTLPNSILLIITPYLITERYKWDLEFRAFADFIYFFTNILWYVNGAINFYIYCLTGHKFRTEIKSLLCERKGSGNLNETMHLQKSRSRYFSNTSNSISIHDNTEEI